MSTTVVPAAAGAADPHQRENPFAVYVTHVQRSGPFSSGLYPDMVVDPGLNTFIVGVGSIGIEPSWAGRCTACFSGVTMSGSWAEVATRIAAELSTSSQLSPIKDIGSDTHPKPAAATRVRRVKDDSGLTWDQFRRLFGVSQRSVHLWASGGRMSARNEERLAYIEQVVSALGFATPEQRRDSLLMSPAGGGRSIFQKLAGSASQTAPVDIEALTESSGDGPTIHGDFLFAEEIGDSGQSR